jgi:hypothetical protein
MENTECKLPVISECPKCHWPVTVNDFNDGECPKCNKSYTWVTVGAEDAEKSDSGHDYISWK